MMETIIELPPMNSGEAKCIETPTRIPIPHEMSKYYLLSIFVDLIAVLRVVYKGSRASCFEAFSMVN